MGEADSIDHAAEVYAPAVAAPLHLVAIGANAAVAEPHVVVAYELGDGPPKYMLQRLAPQPSEPPLAGRVIAREVTARLLEAVVAHPRYERLRRSMEHYAEALRQVNPWSTIPPANALWIAVETLTDVIVDRLCEEAGHADRDAMARAMGFVPRHDGDRSHVYAMRGEVRLRDVFAGNQSTHRDLKNASDGFEHGYMDFESVREHARRAFDPAAGLVRQAVLRECRVDLADLETLTRPPFENPLAMWPMRIFAAGTMNADPARLDPNSLPIIYDVVPQITRTGFDVDNHATEGDMTLRIGTDEDGTEFAVRQFSVTSPGQLEVRLSSPDHSATT